MMPQRASERAYAPTAGSWPAGMRVSGGLMVVAVVLAWHNCFSGAFIYDDVPAVMGNLSIRSLRSLGEIFSPGRTDLTVSGRPLANFSLAVNYALGGTQVAGYHALNLLIHLLAGTVLFGIVRRTLTRPALRDRFGAAAPWLALTVAVLWLVHPLQTEAVTYTIQRVESLMGLFYLLTLYCFIRGAESARPAKWHVAAVMACVAGMGSKEVMVSAPVMVLVYDRTFFAASFREALGRRGWLYAGLAASWLPLFYWVSSSAGRGGTAGFGGPVTWPDYARIQCEAIVHYVRLAFWPQPLVFDYGIMKAPGLAGIALQAVLLLVLAAATLVALWRKTPAGCLGAWFYMILAPSSSFVPVTTESMAEHRMYLPLAAIVVLAVLGLYRLMGLRLLPIYAVLAVGLGWITSERNNDYRSEIAIWSDTVAKQPDNARAWNNLGTLWLGDGNNLAEAGRCFTEAVRLQPYYASAHYNLGIVLARTGRDADAIGHFLAAIRLEDGFVDARINAGNAYLKLGRPSDAAQQYEAALRLQPDSPDLHYNLGLALDRLGRPGAAIREYQAALQLDPGRPQTHLDLAAVEARQGDPAAAERDYREAIRLQPGQAATHFSFGELLRQMNRLPEAIEEYQKTLQAEPGNLQARLILGNLLLMTRRIDEAIDQYEQILRVQPNDPGILQNLEQARAMKQSPAQAP
jgi:tetratricopeptide (TPR) repeat protein